MQTRNEMTRRWIPHTPTAKQQSFLDCPAKECFYGGAAGGGKTDALLMAALAYVDVPGYAALLFRRTFADLSLPGALMDRARDWLSASTARWNAHDHVWTFPSGATLTFGYLETERDKYRYQSSEVQFVGFDEVTEFGESQYLYLFSRLRRLAGSTVPLRMRSASNPGGIGHEWVRARFVDHDDDADDNHDADHAAKRIFIPARLADNPHLDREEYADSLRELDPVTRAQLLEGDWQIRPEGAMFKRDWLTVVENKPERAARTRYWDKACTEGGGARSAGVLIARTPDKLFYIEDAVFGHWSAHKREQIIRETAEHDGEQVSIWVEQEPGSGGKESAEATIRNLAGWNVHADRVTGDKVTRARPLAAQCEAGNVRIVRGSWNQEYLEELCSFPLGVLKDLVDASSGAFNKASRGASADWTPEAIARVGKRWRGEAPRGKETWVQAQRRKRFEREQARARAEAEAAGIELVEPPEPTAEEKRAQYNAECAEMDRLALMRARGFR
jgi:predicted phage terminase large subunit-like protein